MYHAELDRLIVARQVKIGPFRQDLVVDLSVRDGRLKRAAPVDRPKGSIDQVTLMQINESLVDTLPNCLLFI